MSDQEEYRNGHVRETDKKPRIRIVDIENLIDFGDIDDDDDIDIDDDGWEDVEEVSEELHEPIPHQVQHEAAQLLEDSNPEIEEVPLLPEVLHGSELADGIEQLIEVVDGHAVVEQQVLQVAEVLIELVEERAGTPCCAEEQGLEEPDDRPEREATPQVLNFQGHEESPSSQGSVDLDQEEKPSYSCQDAFAEGTDGEPWVHDQSTIDDLYGRRSGSGQISLDQDSNEGSSGSDQGLVDEDQNVGPSRLCQGTVDQLSGDRSESGPSAADQDVNGGPSVFGQGTDQDGGHSGRGAVDQDLKEERLRKDRYPVEQDLSEGPSGAGQRPMYQDLNRESCTSSLVDRALKKPSESGPRAADQDPNKRRSGEVSVDRGLSEGPSCSGQGSLMEQGQNEGPSGSFQRQDEEHIEGSSGSTQKSIIQRLNGGPSRSGEDPIEQRVRDGNLAECEEAMEQVELEENDGEADAQAHPIPVADMEIERRPDMQQDFRLLPDQREIERQGVIAAEEMEQSIPCQVEDLNGGPESGPDPLVQREKVGQAAENEGVVGQPEAALQQPINVDIEAVPIQDEDINLGPAELDNLVEQIEVQVVPLPEDVERGDEANEGLGEAVREERDAAAEVQSVQTK